MDLAGMESGTRFILASVLAIAIGPALLRLLDSGETFQWTAGGISDGFYADVAFIDPEVRGERLTGLRMSGDCNPDVRKDSVWREF
jgi:hypothetical protein